mmetsp:Transcript_14419/g.21029  ORF Transcript_14419/g.21029 Transcript_14419/m.21029 type:complete len:486 (+) Transcript_14419:59-1516(+)
MGFVWNLPRLNGGIERRGVRFVSFVSMSWEVARTRLERVADKQGIDAAKLFVTSQVEGDLRPPLVRDDAVRTFGKAQEDIRVTLYRDPAYWCPYCQRVQLQLELKRIPYRVKTVNMRCYGEKPDYFRALVPSGAIPAVSFDDGPVKTESLDLMLEIERMFPDNSPLIPPEDNEMVYKLFRNFMQLERRLFSSWFQYMSSGGGGFGLFGGGKDSFISDLEAWDAAMAQINSGPFALGSNISLVDILAVPFVERMVASALYWKAINIREDYPGIDAWLKGMETVFPAYRTIRADIYSTVHNLPPQTGRATFDSGSDQFREAIDGVGNNWELPLVGSVSYDRIYGDDSEAKIEAAAALIRGSEFLVPFAMRAIGVRKRTVSAPLADPDAQPVLWGKEYVEQALFGVALALIDGTEAPEAIDASKSIPADEQRKVIASLAYLRDRIGVPRDMSPGAARQLRCHLNWFCRSMLGEERWAEIKPEYAVQSA